MLFRNAEYPGTGTSACSLMICANKVRPKQNTSKRRLLLFSTIFRAFLRFAPIQRLPPMALHTQKPPRFYSIRHAMRKRFSPVLTHGLPGVQKVDDIRTIRSCNVKQIQENEVYVTFRRCFWLVPRSKPTRSLIYGSSPSPLSISGSSALRSNIFRPINEHCVPSSDMLRV